MSYCNEGIRLTSRLHTGSLEQLVRYHVVAQFAHESHIDTEHCSKASGDGGSTQCAHECFDLTVDDDEEPFDEPGKEPAQTGLHTALQSLHEAVTPLAAEYPAPATQSTWWGEEAAEYRAPATLSAC